MIYAHFMRHECTPATRRAVLKRVYSDQFEFLECNKRNGFSKGRGGKRVPNASAEAAHTKGGLALLKWYSALGLQRCADPRVAHAARAPRCAQCPLPRGA